MTAVKLYTGEWAVIKNLGCFDRIMAITGNDEAMARFLASSDAALKYWQSIHN